MDRGQTVLSSAQSGGLLPGSNVDASWLIWGLLNGEKINRFAGFRALCLLGTALVCIL